MFLAFIIVLFSVNLKASITWVLDSNNNYFIKFSCKESFYSGQMPLSIFQEKMQNICHVSIQTQNQNVDIYSELSSSEIVEKAFDILVNFTKSRLKSKGKEIVSHKNHISEKALKDNLEYFEECLKNAIKETFELKLFTAQFGITIKQYESCEKTLLQHKSKMPYVQIFTTEHVKHSPFELNQEMKTLQLIKWHKTLGKLIDKESRIAKCNQHLFKKHLEQLAMLQDIEEDIRQIEYNNTLDREKRPSFFEKFKICIISFFSTNRRSNDKSGVF